METATLIKKLEGHRLTAYEDGGEHFFGCRLRSLTENELDALVRRHCANMHNVLRMAIPSFDGMEDGMQRALMLIMHYMGERHFFQSGAAALDSAEALLSVLPNLPLPTTYKEAIKTELLRCHTQHNEPY